MPTNRKFNAYELVVGKTYRVIVAFMDFDGITHEVGESWSYFDKNWFPYESGLTLYLDEGKQRQLRLQSYPESQGEIIENFSNYVKEL